MKRVMLVLAIAGIASVAYAQDAGKVGVVSHIKVLSDKCEDVSSPEDWKKTYIKEGMSDEDKAIAIWKTVVKYRHQDGPPDEGVSGGGNVHDPFKTIHVYGYGMCCCASSNIEGLARFIGMPARGRQITQHSVPEVWYDNSWHLLDASLMCYFRNKDGKIASVDEIKASIQEWRKEHPEIKNDADLKNYSKDEGWKKGPTVLATNLYYDKNGINSALWHGWWSNVTEYNYKQGGNKIVCPPDPNGAFNLFDYGPSMGYQLNIQLRDGEKLTRCWGNKGDVLNGTNPQLIKGDRGPLGLQKQFGDNAPGRIGNGTVEYAPPMASLAATSLKFDNLAADGQHLRVKDGAKPGELIIRMPCSYVYLDGDLAAKAAIGKDGAIAVSLSDNQGLDWKEVAKIDASGDQKINLKKFIRGTYDYRLKFDFTGAGTGLDSLKITDAFQHSQAPLPVILEGDNKINFSAGPQEGTITYEGALEASKGKGSLLYTDFHPVINDLDKDLLRVGNSGKGDITFNISTPGDLARIRINSHYRCRDITGRDYWQTEVSYDGGKTFNPSEKLDKAQPASSKYFTISDVPPGTKEAQVRFSAKQGNTVCMFDLRIDADYKEPAGGFRPVKVTYVWDEAGQEKKDEHVCKTAEDTWTIKCGPKTVAKSYTVELAN